MKILFILTLTSRFNLSIKIFFCSGPKSIVRFSSKKSLSFNVGQGFNFCLSDAVLSTVEPYKIKRMIILSV